MKALQIFVTITEYENSHTISAEKGERLKAILDREGIKYDLPCGGGARCGRCKVRFLKGAPLPDVYEEVFLSEKEAEDGVRLLCRSIVYEDCEVELLNETLDQDMEIESMPTDFGTTESSRPQIDGWSHEVNEPGGYGIAIDLGTTTVAAALIRATEKKSRDAFSSSGQDYQLIRTASCVNSQRKYGADVISRIAAAEDKSVLQDLSALAVSDIESLVKELTAAEGISYTGENPDLKAITIAGNTTMMNLLAGRGVSGLGKYPYTSEYLGREWMLSDIILPNIPDIKLTLLPGISGFVGADIVAGLFAMDLESEEKFFFLDLGTNGEMAFYDGENLNVTSTAAGPVFEAGGISAGVASVPGAISHVKIEGSDHHVTYETIGGKAPIGICGTGVMEAVSELVRTGLIDETGLLTEKYFEEGFPITEDGKIRFTQTDVRNVQLAKAAILTGAKALLQEKQPDRVYIAGGFGSQISQENVLNLRMFPGAFDGKIVAVGNSALKGAALYTAQVLRGWEAEADAVRKLDLITEGARVTQLAQLDSFDEDYINAMNFGDEDFV